MHDLDRALRELESEMDELEGGDYEYEFEPAGSGELEADFEADYEADEMEDEGDYEGALELAAEGDWEAEAAGDEEAEYEGDYETDSEGEDEADFEDEFEDEFEGDYEGDYEEEGEGDLAAELEGEAVFDEVEEMELAAALLEVGDDQEVEQFLGSLLKKAGRALGKAFRSPAGLALVGSLKDIARKALPLAGAALGNVVAPGIGGVAGGKAAAAAGRIFGLELEGMSPQDQEFEVARRFVRLAGGAARAMATDPNGGSPEDMAKSAVMQAAQQHAPGLTRGWRRRRRGGARYAWAGGDGRPGGRRGGRWVRRGRRIILYGV